MEASVAVMLKWVLYGYKFKQRIPNGDNVGERQLNIVKLSDEDDGGRLVERVAVLKLLLH